MVFINKIDVVDEEMVEFCEIEVWMLLDEYGYLGFDIFVIYGLVLCVLNNEDEEIGKNFILKLV